ncbi:MAG: hypothetical protein NTV22_00405, partial [bacterium]|nr:hypothetical protein [bacterium]
MRLLMYVLAVVVVLAIAVLCLRGCGHVPTAPAPQAAAPTVNAPTAAPTIPPLAGLQAADASPPPSLVTNVITAPPVADATLVTLEIILSGQRGIPYEGTVRVDAYDMAQQYAGARQTKQVQGEPALRFSNVPPMDCHITVRLKGYLTTTTNVPLAEDAGTFQTVILQLSALRELRGTVVDATTKTPISYAGVALIADGTNTVCCDAAGAFAFNEVQDEIASLMAWHAEYPTQQFSIFVPPDGTSSAMLELVRAAPILKDAESNAQPLPPPSNGWIHIIARGTAGEPVTNAIISFVNQFNSTIFGAFDSTGECVLQKPVGPWDIGLLCAGMPPLRLNNIVVRYQETTVVHAALCTLPTPVFGQARRANGTEAAGICIYAAPEDKRAGVGFGAQTDSRGEFSIPVAHPDLLYKLTVNEVEIDQPREAVKPGDFVQVVLKPYSVVELQAVASNTMVYIASLNYWGARTPQG